MTKLQLFEYELKQYDLNQDAKNVIKEHMLDGLEIMSKKEIKQCIYDHVELMGLTFQRVG